MKYSVIKEGLNEAIRTLSQMTAEGKSSMNSALSDVGKMIVKELKRERRQNNLLSLGHISKALGHKKPWGKVRFVSVRIKRRKSMIIVTSKGLNRKLEEGGFVTISDKFKRFLHSKNIHLKAANKKFWIKPRPLFKNTWEKVKNWIGTYFETRFIYRLNRALRGRKK